MEKRRSEISSSFIFIHLSTLYSVVKAVATNKLPAQEEQEQACLDIFGHKAA